MVNKLTSNNAIMTKEISKNKKYSFNIKRIEEIFNLLIQVWHLKHLGNHTIPTTEQIKKKKYWKCHDS